MWERKVSLSNGGITLCQGIHFLLGGVSSLLIGCIIGAAFAGKLSDHHGRRTMLIVTSLFFAVSCLATGLALDFIFFFLVRMIGGLAVGAASILSPMYISEVSPSKYGGRMVVLYKLAIVTGIGRKVPLHRTMAWCSWSKKKEKDFRQKEGIIELPLTGSYTMDFSVKVFH